eukprot:TRINITY_DN103_c0_g1_i2.p1 TRINITY_DN103_c0_g1~~TRINITY_DN103_c0_g1_i2.p1  ORF type:complete len:220 (-),score=-16.97 TRINITY_DN103_c0_g1_i2:1050-1709(-)
MQYYYLNSFQVFIIIDLLVFGTLINRLISDQNFFEVIFFILYFIDIYLKTFLVAFFRHQILYMLRNNITKGQNACLQIQKHNIDFSYIIHFYFPFFSIFGCSVRYCQDTFKLDQEQNTIMDNNYLKYTLVIKSLMWISNNCFVGIFFIGCKYLVLAIFLSIFSNDLFQLDLYYLGLYHTDKQNKMIMVHSNVGCITICWQILNLQIFSILCFYVIQELQ